MMGDLLTPDQLDILISEQRLMRRRDLPLGTDVATAVGRPGLCWAENAVQAGHVPEMRGVHLALRARVLVNREHLTQHVGDDCPTDWQCLDVVPAYRRWSRALQSEARLYLAVVRGLS